MKKKYSDPLMFSSVLLSGIDIPPSGGEGGSPGDNAWGGKKAKLTIDSTRGTVEPAEDVKIVSPVEEATAGVNDSPVESEDTAETTVIPEVTPVIDTLVEEETNKAGTTTPASAE